MTQIPRAASTIPFSNICMRKAMDDEFHNILAMRYLKYLCWLNVIICIFFTTVFLIWLIFSACDISIGTWYWTCCLNAYNRLSEFRWHCKHLEKNPLQQILKNFSVFVYCIFFQKDWYKNRKDGCMLNYGLVNFLI